MFDFLKGPVPRNGVASADEAYDNMMQRERDKNVAVLSRQMHEMQKVVDAMAKVYVAEHAKDIADRAYADKFYQTDQPIIDRAKRLELERQIMVAEMELRELKRKAGVND